MFPFLLPQRSRRVIRRSSATVNVNSNSKKIYDAGRLAARAKGQNLLSHPQHPRRLLGHVGNPGSGRQHQWGQVLVAQQDTSGEKNQQLVSALILLNSPAAVAFDCRLRTRLGDQTSAAGHTHWGHLGQGPGT